MARIIEFHVPTGFTSTTKYVPPQERGALIVFPPNLTRSASDASALSREMTQENCAESLELAVVIWPYRNWSVYESRRSPVMTKSVPQKTPKEIGQDRRGKLTKGFPSRPRPIG